MPQRIPLPASKSPQWPENLKTEFREPWMHRKPMPPRSGGREIEAACIVSFIFSQPVGEQAELAELRWLLGATCDMPAVLNAGLTAWAKNSWYLEECETTEAGTGVPRSWRLGPNRIETNSMLSYKRQAMNHAKRKFDELALTKCPPLLAGCVENSVKPHNLPSSPSEVEDDGLFRLVVLGADYAGVIGDPPNQKACGIHQDSLISGRHENLSEHHSCGHPERHRIAPGRAEDSRLDGMGEIRGSGMLPKTWILSSRER